MNQEQSIRKHMGTLYNFAGRYPYIVSEYNKHPSSVVCDSVPMAQLYYTFPMSGKVVVDTECSA